MTLNYETPTTSSGANLYALGDITELYNNKAFIVESSNNKGLIGKTTLLRLTGKHSDPEKSAEHIAFYGELQFIDNSTPIKIVVKFVKKYTMERLVRVKKFTSDHARKVILNYDKAQDYLDGFNHNDKTEKIKLNEVIILHNSMEGHLWLEKELEPFIKFWDKTHKLKEFQITTTQEPTLREFQKFIFSKSLHFHTLIDLQGGKEEKDNIKYIVITDVEFTDTLEKLGWKQDTLIRSFRKVYGIGDIYVEKQEFGDIKDQIEKDIQQLGTKVDTLSTQLTEIHTLSKQLAEIQSILTRIANNPI